MDGQFGPPQAPAATRPEIDCAVIPVFHRRLLLAGLRVVLGVPLLACGAEPVIPAIGLADRSAHSAFVQVARDVLNSEAARGDATGIRIIARPTGSLSNQDSALTWANSLASLEGLVGVVGHRSSTISLLAAPIYNEAGVVQVVAIGTNTLLGDVGPWTFQLPPTDSIEGSFIGAFVERYLHGQAVTVYFVADTYGKGLRDGVLAALEQRGVAVLATVPFGPEQRCPPQSDRNFYRSIVETSLKHGTPDVAVIAGWEGEARCLATALNSLAPGVRIVAGDGVNGSDMLRSALGPSGDSFYLVQFWHPEVGGSVSRAFQDRFYRIAGRAPTAAEAMDYDAVMVLATAIRAVGPDRRAVREYLADLGHARDPHRGVTGEIAFRNRQDFNLIMIRLGDRAVIEVEPHD